MGRTFPSARRRPSPTCRCHQCSRDCSRWRQHATLFGVTITPGEDHVAAAEPVPRGRHPRGARPRLAGAGQARPAGGGRPVSVPPPTPRWSLAHTILRALRCWLTDCLPERAARPASRCSRDASRRPTSTSSPCVWTSTPRIRSSLTSGRSAGGLGPSRTMRRWTGGTRSRGW